MHGCLLNAVAGFLRAFFVKGVGEVASFYGVEVYPISSPVMQAVWEFFSFFT